MASRYEVEVTLSSAKDLKNVNWRNGPLKPYVVLWVDPKAKSSTVVDKNGDTCPTWDETLVIPLYAPIDESTLFIDVVHALNDEDRDTKPLIGSARISLNEVVEEVGFGDRFTRSLRLKRPSGRPHGKVEVKVCVKDSRYRAPDTYCALPGSREYSAPSPYGNTYGGGSPPRQHQPSPYNEYGALPPPEPQYVDQSNYGHGQHVKEKKKESKYGIGTGLAVGAVAGASGGIAIMEGVDYVEDKIADDVEVRIEEYCDDGEYDHDHDHDSDHDHDNHYDDDDYYDNDD